MASGVAIDWANWRNLEFGPNCNLKDCKIVGAFYRGHETCSWLVVFQRPDGRHGTVTLTSDGRLSGNMSSPIVRQKTWRKTLTFNLFKLVGDEVYVAYGYTSPEAAQKSPVMEGGHCIATFTREIAEGEGLQPQGSP